MDYPDLIIGGSHHGFFELNDASIVEDVKNSNADIIFVALGFPRQEKWIYQNYETFDKGVFMGVGGSFDVISERSEEHTSELQSRGHLVCRLLLEKKKKKTNTVQKYIQNT